MRSDERIFGKVFCILALTFIVVIPASIVHASLVEYTLYIDSGGPGTWKVCAEASVGDNAGLALVSVPLVNVDFPVTIETPYIEYFDGSFFQVGMHNFEVAGTSPIGSSQDLVTPMPAVYGFGQSAGTLTMPGSATWLAERNVNYDAELLVATGTYSGDLPDFGDGGSANVFVDDTGISVESATLNFTVVPEPATLGLLLLGGLSLTWLQKRKR